MTTLAEAFVKIRPDASKFGPELEKGVGASGHKVGSLFGANFKTGLKAAGVGVGLLAVQFFKGALSEAAEAQKVGAQTAAVLKSTGQAAGISAKQISDLATSISNKTGIDDEAIQANENLLLTFTNLKNGVGKGNDVFNQAAVAVQDMSAALGQDGKSSAIQLGKALNDPIKGITALSRVGVSFTDQQKKQIATLVKSGNVLGAQKVILGEVQREFAGSAAAIATPGDKMKVAWGNLQETIGLKLLPVLNRLIPPLTKVIGFVADHAAAFGILAGGILAVVGAMKLWTLWTNIQAAATKVAAAVQVVWNAVMMANPIGLVVLAIATLVAAVVLIATKTHWFQNIWHAAWGAITGAVSAAIGWIKRNWPLLLAILTGPIGLAVRFITQHWDTIVATVKGLPGRIASAASGMWDGIKNAFRAAINWIIDRWNNLHFTIPGVNTHIPGVGTIGGFTLGTPDIPRLAAGGIVPATRGGRLALLGEGGQDEAVIPLSKMGRGPLVIENHIEIGGEVVRVVRTEINENDRGTRRSIRAGAGARSSSVRYAG